MDIGRHERPSCLVRPDMMYAADFDLKSSCCIICLISLRLDPIAPVLLGSYVVDGRGFFFFFLTGEVANFLMLISTSAVRE